MWKLKRQARGGSIPVAEIASMASALSHKMKNLLPKLHVLDVRSLAMFRILFGLFLLYDVLFSRTRNGKYDLAWYTSDPPERSYIKPDSERVLAYYGTSLVNLTPFARRGTVDQEIAFFVSYAVLALFLTIGFQCQHYWLLSLLWFMTRGLIRKAQCMTDGSDNLVCQLLLWMLFLPVSQVWSVDALLLRRHKRHGKDSSPIVPPTNHQVSGIACFGLLLQICMVYGCCIMTRTFDNYSLSELQGTDWFGPEYSLVYYAANGSGTLKTILADWIRTSPRLCQYMTWSAFWIEATAPLLCLLWNQRYSHWFAFLLASLHLGIGSIINIPHWTMLGVMMQLVWIPTHVWDGWFWRRGPPSSSCSTKVEMTNQSSPPVPLNRWNPLPWFYFYLLVSTWCLHRGWSAGIFVSDFSESLASLVDFTNYWGMWDRAPRLVPFTTIRGWRKRHRTTLLSEDGLRQMCFLESSHDGHDFIGTEKWETVDVFHLIRTGEELEMKKYSEDYFDYSTYTYPTTRWEKGLGDEWNSYLKGQDGYDWTVKETLATALCHMVNEDLARRGTRTLETIEIVVRTQGVSPPFSHTRYTDEGYVWYSDEIDCDE